MPQEKAPDKPAQEPGTGTGGKGSGKQPGNRNQPKDGDRPPQTVLDGAG